MFFLQIKVLAFKFIQIIAALLIFGVINSSYVMASPPANGNKSTISASPASVIANNTASSVITVTINDSSGSPMQDKAVTLTQTGSSTITPSSGVTNASGQVTFTVTDWIPEAVTYTATDTTDNITLTSTAIVTFTQYINPALSTVTASPTSVFADNTTTSTITVTIKDGSGAAIAGKAVSLTANLGSSTISVASGVSSASGVVIFTVKDAVVETIIYTAKDTTDSVVITNTAQVAFSRMLAPVVAKSFSPSTITVNGFTVLTITLTNNNSGVITGGVITDTYPANLVNTATPLGATTCTGGTVVASSGGNSVALSGGSIPANGSCTVKVNVTSTTIGVYTNTTNTATSNNATTSTTASAQLTVTGVNASNSTATAAPASVAADNTAVSTITVTLKDVNNVAVSGKIVTLSANFGSSTISAASGVSSASGVVTFTVKDAVAEGPITYTAIGDGIILTQTVNLIFTTTVVPGITPDSFNCVEVGGAINTNLYTKLSGNAFNIDIVAVKSGVIDSGYVGTVNKSVTLELVDGASSAVCSSMTALTPSVSLVFTSANLGRNTSAPIELTNAYANLRCRITDTNQSPTVVGCSTDNFSVRPQAFAMTGNLGGSTLSAGSNFTMTANSGVSSGYTGTPVLSASLARDHNGASAGTLAGLLGTATGVSSTGTFQYQDVGTISLLTDAVTDTNYTSIDQSTDCVVGSTSNTLVGGKFGCNIGSTASAAFGRFYPHHFTYSSTLTPSCAIGGFSYMDQAALGVNLTLTAQSLSGVTTSRYTSGYSSLGTFAITGDNSGIAVAASRLSPVLPAFTWNNGVYTATGNRSFTRNATLDGPYESFALKASVTDPDGASITGSTLSNTSPIRSGRISLQNTNGSELLNLPIPVEAQYWKGSYYATNTADNCTTIATANIGFGNYQGGLSPANMGAGQVTIGQISSGVGSITLTKPLVTGSVDLALDLGSTVTPNISWATSVEPTAGANLSHLRSEWYGSAYDRDPTSRATFGIYNGGSNLMYIRENYY